MNFGVPEYAGNFNSNNFSCDKPKRNAVIPAIKNM
jgi:hypothetical protein